MTTIKIKALVFFIVLFYLLQLIQAYSRGREIKINWHYDEKGFDTLVITQDGKQVPHPYGFAGDIGLLYMLPFIRRMKAGKSVQNIGNGIKFDEIKFPLPLNFKGGIGYAIG
jgi:hypothetical protein